MSAKARDNHNRWRSKTVAFRMSPEEVAQLNAFVQMSGLQKQDYLIRRVLQKDVVVEGNVRVYKGLKLQMESITAELQRILDIKDCDPELLERMEQIETIMRGMKES